jgi:hypothetical protein
MANTPAAVLARLKIQYPAWRIERQAGLFTATERDGKRVIRAGSIGQFESQLARVDCLSGHGRGAP